MSYHEGSNWQAKKEDAGKPLYENHNQQVDDLKDELASKDSLMEGYRQQIDQLNKKLEAEATRAAGLVECLQGIKASCEATGDKHWQRDVVINDILKQVRKGLANYNNPVNK